VIDLEDVAGAEPEAAGDPVEVAYPCGDAVVAGVGYPVSFADDADLGRYIFD
jgi:hypothetical protein